MKRVILGLAVVMAFGSVSSMAVPAMAATTAKTMKCPECGMSLSTKKTAAMNVPVKIKGKTYYCCAKCKMMTSKKTM